MGSLIETLTLVTSPGLYLPPRQQWNPGWDYGDGAQSIEWLQALLYLLPAAAAVDISYVHEGSIFVLMCMQVNRGWRAAMFP